MTFPGPALKKGQQGAATLIVVLVLAMIMGVIALTSANIGVMEQKIVGNDLRAREAHEAAEAGLEYGVAWASTNTITTSLNCSTVSLPTGCPTALTTVSGSSTGESYTYTLTYTKGTSSLEVTSVAQGVNDATITATSQAWIKQISYLTTAGQSAPPMVINGGLSGVTGNPTIDSGNPPGTAILTDQPTSSINTGHLGGNPTLGATVSSSFPATSTPAWSELFSMPLASAIAIATANGYVDTLPTTPAAGKEPFFVVTSGSPFHQSLGSATSPIVLIFSDPLGDGSGCPKINGGPTIYGIIYYAATCSGQDQGWGGATVYGSVVMDSSVTKLTANGNIIGNGTPGAGNLFNNFLTGVARIPGTWKDF
ncbi:MAG TPA: PilX N-terminal domain-containing pilus assembly protein [Methylobacter sp.]|jgi:Tfp pilus assembly protein PilX